MAIDTAMSGKLRTALLAALNLDTDVSGPSSAEAAAGVLTDVLCAFGQVIGAASMPPIEMVEMVKGEAVCNDNHAEMVAQLQALNAQVSALIWDTRKPRASLSETAASIVAGVDTTDGGEAVAIAPRNEEWRIEIRGEKFRFARYIGGRCNESYRTATAAEAAVWSAAIIQGYEPPRVLVGSDRPGDSGDWKRPLMTFAIPREGEVSIFLDEPSAQAPLKFSRAQIPRLLDTLEEVNRIAQRLTADEACFSSPSGEGA